MGNKKEKAHNNSKVDPVSSSFYETKAFPESSKYEFAQEMGLFLRQQKKKLTR